MVSGPIYSMVTDTRMEATPLSALACPGIACANEVAPILPDFGESGHNEQSPPHPA
jgi:hypothetical protein